MELDEARERARRAAHLNAFLCFTDEHGPGPAVAVKDLIDVRGVPTTGGGVILPRVPATADAPVITRIRAGGCGVIGKTNLHEWAYGATSRNPHYGDVPNPRLPGRSAGGSSSGSAAAVAAGLCDWAIGTDTAGSVRIPASLCGIVGFRPTYGTIPTGKVLPLARSLDTVGSLALTVQAAADAIALMAGWPGRFRAPDGSASRLRLARPAGWADELDEPTTLAWAEVGSRLPEVTLPDPALFAQTAVTIQSGEAAAFHRDWMRAGAERYGADVRAKLEAALEVRAADYVRACDERPALTEAVEQVLAEVDALVLPATAMTAPPLDGPEHREELLRFTRPFSLTGHPCIVIPAPAAGPPVGIQLVGKHGSDARLAEVAHLLLRSWT
jgi:Asp-tRNA(Asn)/Glu-tRNA(Gln) amidotransferase A subunit family amidase